MLEKGVAFLVGIDEYQNSYFQDLQGTMTANVRSLLEVLELKVSQYKPQIVLTQQPIDYAKLNQELTSFLSEKNYKDVLIYFSGHGYQIADEEGKYQGYLATSDSVLFFRKNGELCTHDPEHSLSLSHLSKLIAKATHLSSLVLLIDACHSSIALQDNALRSSFLSLEPHFKYCIVVSSLGSEESFSGVFTEALVEGLSNQNLGPITADDVFKYVQERLINETQHPAL